MAVTQEKLYTIDDIYNLPEGERAELIDGNMYMMAPPGLVHQRVSGFIYAEIYQHIKEQGGSCEVFSAPFAVFLDANNRTYVEPDISVICDKGKLDERGCNGAPDWIIEIVSASSRRMDYFTKLFKYRAAGVKEYWIIDPVKLEVMVYDFENNTGGEYFFIDEIPSITLKGLSIKLKK